MFVAALVATFLGLGFFIAVEVLRRILVTPWNQT
jgi:hypothetical protein